MQPVPIERVGEAAFAAVDVGALQARLDELLARHADFFPVEPNTLWWTSRRGDHQFRGTDVPPNLSTVLGHLMAADGEFATLRVGHRRASENYTAHPFYFDSPEWVEVRINRTTSTVRLAACLGDRARADAALDLVIGAFELTTAGEIERKQRLARLRGLAGRLDHLRSDAALTPQARGKRFESWLVDLFDLYGLEANPDVQNPEEQIDFTFWLHASQFVIGEARWLNESVSAKQMRDFLGKLDGRPAAVVGLFISMSGFTEPAMRYLRQQSAKHTVLTVSDADLAAILRGEPELPEWLTRALRARFEHPFGDT